VSLKKDNHRSLARVRKELGEERFALVNTMLAKGESVTYVARMIQHEWKAVKRIKEDSLRRQLIRHRDKYLVHASYVEALPLEQKNQIIEKLENHVSALDEMHWLILEHKKRIQLARNKEDKLQFPFQWLGKDIEVMMNLLEKFATHQFNLGLIEYAPQALARKGVQVAVGVQAPGAPGQTTTVQVEVSSVVDEALRIIDGHYENVTRKEEALVQALPDAQPPIEPEARPVRD
jgi:hypothetical protein